MFISVVWYLPKTKIIFMVKLLESFIVTHGALAVFVVGILEDILFFVPSSLVFMGAGFLLIPKGLTFWAAVSMAGIKIGVPATLGVTLGSLIVYVPVYIWGKPVVVRYGKYFGFSWQDIEAFQKKIAVGYSDEVVLFFLRAIPVIPLAIASTASGLVRLPVREFISMTFLGILVRVMVCATIGWRVGKAYLYYADQFAVVERYGLVALFIVGMLILWHLHKRFEK